MTKQQLSNYFKVLLLLEQYGSFDRARHDVACCKGCYASHEYTYCADCYAEIMEGETLDN